jgi:hypothetical protein
MKFTFVCACGKVKERKIYLKLEFEVIKNWRLYFPQRCDGFRNSHLSFKWPLVDSELDMHSQE